MAPAPFMPNKRVASLCTQVQLWVGVQNIFHSNVHMYHASYYNAAYVDGENCLPIGALLEVQSEGYKNVLPLLSH